MERYTILLYNSPSAIFTELKLASDKIVSSKNNTEFYLPLTPQGDECQPKTPPGITIDQISYNVLLSSDSTMFVAVQKTEKTHALSPVKDEKDTKSAPVYQKPQKIGRGSYGDVRYYPTENCAGKKYIRCEDDIGLPQDMIKELGIYTMFKGYEYFPKLYGFCVDPQFLYLEKGDTTLNKKQNLSSKKIMFGLAMCMRATAIQGIIHCDLKPSNILINSDLDVKIIDWGIAEIDASKNQTKIKNTHVQTIWYRAPEVLLLHPTYSHKIDIFSLGLIFLELVTGVNNFQTDDEMVAIRNHLRFLQGDTTIKYQMETLKKYKELVTDGNNRENIKQKLAGKKWGITSENLVDLLSGMLIFNPEHRISYDEIVHHPYFSHEQVREIKIPDVFPVIPDINEAWKNSGLWKKTRTTLFSWLEEVQQDKEDQMSLETLCLAYQLTDWVIYKSEIKTEDLRLIGSVCIILASKIYDSDFVHLDELSYLSDGAFTAYQIKEKEKEIVILLEGNLIIPIKFPLYETGKFVDSKKILAWYLESGIYS